MSNKLSVLAISLFIVLICGIPAHAAIIKGPYLQNTTTNAMSIMWETDSATASTVEYGLTASLGESAVGTAGTIHQVRLTALAEDTEYYYRTVSDTDSSSIYTFRTASSTSTSFRFVAVGDSRSDPSVVATISAMIDALNPRAAFAIHSGDVVSSGSQYALWGTEFFTPEHPMMARLPLYVSIGNHEQNSQNFYNLFDLPGNERWYAFEYGNAVFISLDTNTQYATYAPGSEQYNWLVSALKQYAGKTWKFVLFHNPPYSTGGHGPDTTVRAYLQPVFERYHVDVVFNGHDHDYERSIVNNITYIVTGGFGAPLYSQQSTNPYSQLFSSVHHYCVADINGTDLALNVVDDSGDTVENIHITSPALPLTVITAPADGASTTVPSYVITGTTIDPPPNAGINRVEVSTDGGVTWSNAVGTTSWSFAWKISRPGSYTIKSRAVDIDGNVESPGDSISVTVPAFGETELQHYFWDASLTGGDCGVCHTAPDAFLPAGFLQDEPGLCRSCHNASGVAHGSLAAGNGHSILASVTGACCKMPIYGNITGEYDNRPFASLKGGDKVVCATCHNAMRKTEDFGRVWEMTASSDNLTYSLQNGGWAGYGYLEPRVYRDSSIWTGPIYSIDKNDYLVSPSEYAFDEYSGTITFYTAQDPLDYIYVTLNYPYLRASSKDNSLCSDCHTQITHISQNCLSCHRAHNTLNISGVSDQVRSPDGSFRQVVFQRYTGVNSFADGDSTHDGICEVCHTVTSYYTRDGSGFTNHSGGINYDGSNCTTCHNHANGFAKYQ